MAPQWRIASPFHSANSANSADPSDASALQDDSQDDLQDDSQDDVESFDSDSQDDIDRFEGDSGRAWSQRRHYGVRGSAPQPLALMTREERDERRAARQQMTLAQRQRAEENRKNALHLRALAQRKRALQTKRDAAEQNVAKHRNVMRSRKRNREYEQGIGPPEDLDMRTLNRLIVAETEARRRAKLAEDAHASAVEAVRSAKRTRNNFLRY